MVEDPKYAGLPGIATGQQDTFETYSDQEFTGVREMDILK